MPVWAYFLSVACQGKRHSQEVGVIDSPALGSLYATAGRGAAGEGLDVLELLGVLCLMICLRTCRRATRRL